MNNLNNTVKYLKSSQPAKYRIEVQGRYNETWTDWMEDLEINIISQDNEPTITVVTGIMKDQAGLHGVLNRIRDLSIPLISVQFIHQISLEKE